MLIQQVLLSTLLVYIVHGDLYMQAGIPGSNNRLDEANRERNNGNRLFDSQNNDRGGYNVGKMGYYVDEIIPLQWTLQHGCGTDEVKHCEVVAQVSCDPMMRDGTTTQRIPDNPANCRNFNCDTDVEYGRHESYEFYQKCTQTARNKGLFTSSQNLNRDDATRTRQNPGGTRRGYECPEERDYYPYWRPTPWIDIALMTQDTAKCDEYRAVSENQVGRWECVVPDAYKDSPEWGNGIAKIPITQTDCEQLSYEDPNSGNVTAAQWIQQPAHNMPLPECIITPASRANHHGLIGGSKKMGLNWKVPQELLSETGTGPDKACVFRLRYNISMDIDPSPPNQVAAGQIIFDTLNPGETTAQYNKVGNGGNAANKPATIPLWREYGLTDTENGLTTNADGSFTMENADDGNNNLNLEDNRDYRQRNNPRVDVAGQVFGNDDYRLRLQLAINTAQFGRTFQDRSHMFFIKEKPVEVGDATLKLLTVGGKRGNIVQVYPATEYFFYPEKMHVKKFEFVHFRWTGSNTNPNNNDGQGKQGTDRSNIVPLKQSNYDEDDVAQTTSGQPNVGHYGSLGNSYFAYVKKPELYALAEGFSECSTPDHVVERPMGGFSQEVITSLATTRKDPLADNDFGNMEELDDAGASFNIPPVQATEEGCWEYGSSRNNNFSNRSQKGTICVDPGQYGESTIGPQGDSVVTPSGWLNIPPGALNTIRDFIFETTPSGSAAVSETVLIEPISFAGLFAEEDTLVELGMLYEQRSLSTPKLMHKNDPDAPWREISNVEYKDSDGSSMAVSWVDEGGWYRVEDTPNAGAIAAIVISGLVFFGVVGFMVWYKFFKAPKDDYNINDGTKDFA